MASDNEWSRLTNYLGGDTIAGSKIKEVGTTHWKFPNSGATNESKFTALPEGKIENGIFKQIGDVGSWWTSSSINPSNAWFREVNYYDPNIYRWDIEKQNGFSVRCVKD